MKLIREEIENDGINNSNTNSGHVRVYKYNVTDGWEQHGADIDGEAFGDRSGISVSLSSNGKTVAIGSYHNDDNFLTKSGHVRVFEYDDANEKWNKLGIDMSGEAAGDESGISVSLSSDGRTVAIGASLNDGTGTPDSGHVRVYKYQSV